MSVPKGRNRRWKPGRPRMTAGRVGGPEWRKWCADEGPVRAFRRSQRADRVEMSAAEVERDLDPGRW